MALCSTHRGAVRKTFTAEGIRTAARNFRRNTSIGTDSWTLTELIKMPEVALTELGKLLSDIQFQAIPPLQAMTNIMATLPKKDGGTRTVAIASTVYRLLMELDNQEVAAFEAAEAFECDSAKAGSSAIVAAEDRALETELAKAEGQHVLVVLWDFTKFFDTINVQVLFEEAAKLGFPLRQLLLSTIVHHSPRRLKLGATIGDAISNLGRSILAGCKRSTHLARVYTLRMVRELSSTHASTRTYQHVDDISNWCWESRRSRLFRRQSAMPNTLRSGRTSYKWESQGKAQSCPTPPRQKASPGLSTGAEFP